MLSGESANGKYPTLAAETMMQIVAQADSALDKKVSEQSERALRKTRNIHVYYEPLLNRSAQCGFSTLKARRMEMNERLSEEGDTHTLDSIAAAAVTMAVQIEADLIIAISRKGETVRRLAKYRPHIPIMAFVQTPDLGKRLVLHRGVYPIVMDAAAQVASEHDRVVESLRTAKEIGWVQSGHRVIVVDAELWNLSSTENLTKANCIKVFTM